MSWRLRAQVFFRRKKFLKTKISDAVRRCRQLSALLWSNRVDSGAELCVNIKKRLKTDASQRRAINLPRPLHMNGIPMLLVYFL